MFAGGFDLTSICAVVDGADDVDVLRHLDSLVRKSLVVADHTATRTRYSLFETIRQFAEDRLAEAGALERTRDRHAAHFAQRGRRRGGSTGTGPAGATRSTGWRSELGNLRAGYQWSARRGELEVATDIAAHAALMGFSVQLFETLAWAEELLEPRTGGRRPPSSPPVHGGRLRVLRRDGPRPPARTRTGRPSWRPTPATTRASPGYASFIEALGQVYCGDLDRYVELTGDGGAALRQRSGLRPRRPTSTASSRAAGSRRRSRSPRSPSPRRGSLGNPYWISYALWIAGMAFSKADVRRAFAAWDEGVAFVREHRVQFFEGFLARDAARLHTSDGEPEAALVLFAEAIAAFQRAGNVPQLIITLASVPALFERLDRLAPAAMLLGALSREPSSFHHVPELADLGDRVSRTARARRAPRS